MASNMRTSFRAGWVRRAVRPAALSAAGFVLLTTACKNPFTSDATNPNAIVDSALEDAAGATTLVNGLGASVTRALASVYGPYSAATDELTWVGSREFWKQLDDGEIDDPINEYTDGAYPFVSEARWLANFTIDRVESFETAGTLRNRTDLARAYIFSSIIYITIGDMFDDFVIGSNRIASTGPVGPDNMSSMYDSATVYLDKAYAVAQALGNEELQRQALGLRARSKFSKAVWQKIKPARTTPANPLVSDAGATADATAALALMSGDYRYRLRPTANNLPGINVGFELNNRGELRAGSDYVNADPARPIVPAPGLDGIKLQDPVTGEPDPVLAAIIDECCRPAAQNNVPFTQTSTREMILILAEAALAGNDTDGFRNRINQLRDLNSLEDYDGVSPAPRAMLLHSRRVNLFFQGRRLADHYRFGVPSSRWLPTSAAARRVCFLPISFVERLTNEEVTFNTTERLCN